MDAGRARITVERLTEKYTGMPLIGAGGYFCPVTADARVEIRYDGTPVGVVPIRPGQDSFGTHVPLEPETHHISVVFVEGLQETIWFDGPLAEVGAPPDPAVPARRGKARRILMAAGRAAKALATGQVLSVARWRARLDRWDEAVARYRLRFRDRAMDRRFPARSNHQAYVENTRITPRLRAAMLEEIERFGFQPVISILVPVYNVDPKWLHLAVESVRRQIYPFWELCLTDDASTDPATVRYLKTLPKDPRIKIAFRAKNGHISAATNSAADLASGAYVALLDNDDELSSDALYHVAKEIQAYPDADLIYSDEDKIDQRGVRYDPQFKPDWSPELLLSYNYVNHFTVLRRAAFEKAGRFRVGYEGSQDHDLLLRVTERTDRVRHIPRILYHWRSLPSSTAAGAGVKGYVHVSGRKAVEDALRRRGLAHHLHVPTIAERLGLPILGLDGSDTGPTVSIVVTGPGEAVAGTVAAIRRTTDYVHYSFDSGGELILHLTAGIEPTDRRWLSRLVANLQLPGVGVCGGLIRDGTGSVLSAGIVHGLRDGTSPGDAFRGLPAGQISYYFYAEVTRNVSAVSGSCLLARRKDLGFVDPTSPGWAVKACDRLRAKGMRCLHVGGSELRLAGRSIADPGQPHEVVRTDPYSNPNLCDHASFSPLNDAPLSLTAEATMPPVRVLVAAHNLNNPEGAPRYLSEIVLGLRTRGILDPAVLSPLGGAGAAVYSSAGVPVEIADTPWAWRYVDARWDLREYEAGQADLARRLTESRPDVVLANTLLSFPVVEAAARLGIPTVWIVHESYSPEVLARTFSPFAIGRCERAFRYATCVVPASHDTAELFGRWNVRNNVRVIHNGLDPATVVASCGSVTQDEAKSLISAQPRKKTLIAVGTVCERKGQHHLVEAAARLAKVRDDFEVFLVGARAGEPYVDYTQRLVHRRGLAGVVHLIPEADAVPFFRAADVFVCTSYVETFSRSIMEALAFGLPIVSTACCGVPEQVVWDRNALAARTGDPKDLARQLERLLEDDFLRHAMAAQSRAVFESHLSLDESLDRYAAVILSAARQGQRGWEPWSGFATAVQPPSRRAA